ncbi:hypothetical protein [Glutamicibacter halophytocola]|uniref:hypothetical protein n=1 Tax=Glutamicibacter halophytocola TaxID=1933880 RepID=UPI0015C5311C|nr:hypothetical protein [Glutamicibacter halophytocola]
MAVNELGFFWSGSAPHEADPTLAVRRDAVLASSVPASGIQSVAGRSAEILEHLG